MVESMVGGSLSGESRAHFVVFTDGLNRLRKKSGSGRKDVPQGLNHEWPPQGQLFGTAYATFFTESRRHLARGAQLNRTFVAAQRILNHLRHD